MEKIAPGHVVRRGRVVFPLPYAQQELQVTYRYEGQHQDARRFMEQTDVAGLIVVKAGRVLLERYALGFDDKSLWTSFSVAKSITSTLVGAAIADGHIRSVDDPVVRYLPALRGSAYDGVTLRHVLNMTSGVRWDENYDDPESDVNRCHRATDASLGSPLITYLARLPREAEPGSKWVYKTAETDLAGEIVMAATGKPLAEYLSETIWSRFGMERDAFWLVRSGKELGGCCLSVSLRDYARFGVFMLAGGTAAQDSVLPAGWVSQATSPNQATSGNGERGYGFQWWTGVDGPGTFAARGIFGQSLYVNPADQLVIVTLSAWPRPIDGGRRSAVQAFWSAVREAARVRSAGRE